MSAANYAIFLCLDEKGQDYYCQIIAQTAWKPEWPGHITLLGFDDMPDDYLARMNTITASQQECEITFESIGKFMNKEDIYFIIPTPNLALLSLQKTVFEKFSDCMAAAYYLPNHWMPHCTIALSCLPEKVAAVIKNPPEPINCGAGELWLVDVKNKKMICSMKLGKNS